MAVMERERWTDERIDERFNGVDADNRELRTEMREGFERIEKRFDQFERRFERVDDRFDSVQREMTARFDAVQRNMMTWFVALFSTIISLAVTAAIAFA
jgi:hypothetical protein